MIKKVALMTMALFLFTCALWAPQGIAQNKNLTFGFAMPALTHSYWIPIYYGVQDEIKKFDKKVDLVVVNAGGFNRLDNQIKQVENLIQRKVDAILIGATSAQGIVPVVEEAVKKGIPIIGLGSQPKTEKVLTKVLADDYGMGKIQAEFMGDFYNGMGSVAMMSGPPGLNWTIDRAQGFRETLKKRYPKMKIVAEQWTPVSRPKALNLMEDWIQRFPDLKGVYTANDDLAVGAVEAIKAAGKADQINPLIPVDLVIDHSVQVDFFASPDALHRNAELEFQRNRERYEFLHWGQKAFDNFRVVPPATGIVHQVNLEYLAEVVMTQDIGGEVVAFPDSLVGTDSHTTMINGLGVVGWGVGGIEAEAAMLGQPIDMLTPDVIGFKLFGEVQDGITATDLVLRVVQMLREKGVVGKFVEFFGSGLDVLSLPDRATIANMAPEYGATMGFFPVDGETLRYMRLTGRSEELLELVEKYLKIQHLYREADTPDPKYTDTLELDLGTVHPNMAGPKRPQDRVALSNAAPAFSKVLDQEYGKGASEKADKCVAADRYEEDSFGTIWSHIATAPTIPGPRPPRSRSWRWPAPVSTTPGCS